MGFVGRIRRKLRPPVAAPRAKAPVSFETRVRKGQTLEAASVQYVRDAIKSSRLDEALAFAFSVRDGGSPIGPVLVGIVARHRRDDALAWDALSDSDDALWSRFAAREFVHSGASVDPDGLVERLRAIDDLVVPGSQWLALAQTMYALDVFDLASAYFARYDQWVSPDDEKAVIQRDWFAQWIDRRPDSPTAQVGAEDEGTVSFAVTDYGHPGRSRASANIGDHVQTVASLGHLVRQSNLEFTGDEALLPFIGELQERVRPELRRDEAKGRMRLMKVDRDVSSYAEIPPDTWMLGFGWFMHPVFGIRYGLPFHDNVRPIFVSFHCNKRQLLDDETVEYLRRYGPIGCRDWTTVDLLLSRDVPAFFSGCLTTTINTVFPDSDEVAASDAPTGYVDVKSPPEGAVTYRHSSDAIRFRTFERNCRDAIDLLETYRREHSTVVTSRLHCYLPARSIGVKADFVPKNRADVRFAGLYGLDDGGFDAIRSGIRDLLADVITAIARGDAADEVYALWRALTADAVQAARARREADIDLPTVTLPSPAALTTQGLAEAPVRVIVPVAAGTTADATVASVVEHAPVGVDVVEVDPSTEAMTLLAAIDQLDDHVERCVMIPGDSLVLEDISDLARGDLQGHVIAAPDRTSATEHSGFGRLYAAGNRLAAVRDKATELRRIGHRLHAFDFDAFRSDVLVIDVPAWRRAGTSARLAAYVSEFALSLDEALMLEFGPHRATMDGRWAWIPTRSPGADPALVHWSDSVSPDDALYTPGRGLWREHRGRLATTS